MYHDPVICGPPQVFHTTMLLQNFVTTIFDPVVRSFLEHLELRIQIYHKLVDDAIELRALPYSFDLLWRRNISYPASFLRLHPIQKSAVRYYLQAQPRMN